jgi:hypothetical protein
MRVYVLDQFDRWADAPEPPLGVYATLEGAQAASGQADWRPHEDMGRNERGEAIWTVVDDAWSSMGPGGWYLISAFDVKE